MTSRPILAKAVAILLAALPVASAQAAVPDETEARLARCLDDPANGSTSGQTGCERTALRAYDRRMNLAYRTLLARLPAAAAGELRAAQRAWLAYHDQDRLARAALFATRQGTLYVPMAAAAETRLTRDRALALEAALRVLAIDDE